jgi:hypothetical protein
MKILLCGEGQHEFGSEGEWNPRTKQRESTEGWMQVLVRNLRDDAPEFSIRRRDEIQLLSKSKFRPKLEGHADKARLARYLANNEEFDAVIFMADCDSPDRRDWVSRVEDIQSGFDALDTLDQPIGTAGVVCVPMSASESWLLADSDAWEALGLEDLKKLPPRPETIWGEHDDPEGDRPHRIFKRICDDADVPDNRDTRVQVMNNTAPGTLARKCPISFQPFQAAVTALTPRPDNDEDDAAAG